MDRKIQDINDEDLMEIWPAIGGAPHLFEYGKDELRDVILTGNIEDCGLTLDFFTMMAIVDILRSRGFKTPHYGKPKKEEGMIQKHLNQIKKLGFYYELRHLLDLQKVKCLESAMHTDFYRKNINDFPKSSIEKAPYPDELEQWKDFEPKQP